MEVAVRAVPARNRYELSLDGMVVGVAEYVDREDRRLFTHTEVDPRVGGRGLGERLVRHALDDTERGGLQAVPLCSFVAHVAAGAARPLS